MDAWKTKYSGKKLIVSYNENKILKIYKFYLIVDGIKNELNYI